MTLPEDDLAYLDPPRDLLPRERALVDRLLDAPVRSRDELRAQLRGARVTAEGQGDTRSIRFQLDRNAPRAETQMRIPVEGQAADADGVAIAVLLHVVDGLAEELEIYRVDGELIQTDAFYERVTVAVNDEDPTDP